MSHSERLFLEGGNAKYESGSSISLESLLPNEKKLDEKLWHTPEDAASDITYLLKQTGGEMTPQLSRLALKAISLPLFKREAEGEDLKEDTPEAIETIALRNAVLLQSYLELVDDPDVDQRILTQAINDAVIVQLTSRTLGSINPDLDDVILLPSSGAPQYNGEPTVFTVLRRKSLGRAQLIATAVPHHLQHLTQSDTMYIRPGELTGPKHNIQRLARALVAEQQLEPMSKISDDLVTYATSQLYSKIYDHFDTPDTTK